MISEWMGDPELPNAYPPPMTSEMIFWHGVFERRVKCSLPGVGRSIQEPDWRILGPTHGLVLLVLGAVACRPSNNDHLPVVVGHASMVGTSDDRSHSKPSTVSTFTHRKEGIVNVHTSS